MRQLSDIAKPREHASILLELTSAFEGIASMRIAQIKDQVQNSGRFFDDLWRIYSQLRAGESFNFGRRTHKIANHKELMILITSEGSFSGDVDEKLISQALAYYQPDKNDIIVIGYHGISHLYRQGTPSVLNFKLPVSDKNFDVTPLVVQVQKYTSTTVYYPSYVSLMQQDIKTIVLGSAISQRGSEVATGDDIINEQTYIFEPSTQAVVEHLESAMTGIALSEVILESKLAQYASRFRANKIAHEKADDTFTDLNWQYHRAKRQIKDERLKETINGLRRGGLL